VTRNDVLSRADALVPLLSAESEESDRRGRLTGDSVDALRANDMFTLMKPGPGQACLRTVVEVCTRLAHGSGSAAWLVSLAAGAAYQVSLFDEAARADVWAGDPAAAVCGSIAMSGTAERVPGGFEVTGRWQPVSGIHESAWVTVGVVESESGERLVALLPVAETTVETTWHVAGMRGTGSDTVRVNRVFVPDHHVLPFAQVLARAEPTLPFVSAGVAVLLGPVLGLAEAALDHALTRRPPATPSPCCSTSPAPVPSPTPSRSSERGATWRWSPATSSSSPAWPTRSTAAPCSASRLRSPR
jgi:3-hydroxy-9,10-secoandrosta-1,3,5(10)-triene-9,17-dione monooxygenase